MNKRIVNAVVFDFDGTLVDTESLHIKSFHVASKELDVLKGYNFLNSLGIPEKQFREMLINNFNVPQEFFVRRKEIFSKMLPSEYKLFPGVMDTMKKLKTLGIPIGIASNSSEEHITKISAYTKIDKYIDAYSGYDITGKSMQSKPNPDVYLRALDMIKATPHEAIAVEDTKVGVDAAKNANIYTFGVVNFFDAQTLKKADFIINTIDEIFNHCQFYKK